MHATDLAPVENTIETAFDVRSPVTGPCVAKWGE